MARPPVELTVTINVDTQANIITPEKCEHALWCGQRNAEATPMHWRTPELICPYSNEIYRALWCYAYNKTSKTTLALYMTRKAANRRAGKEIF